GRTVFADSGKDLSVRSVGSMVRYTVDDSAQFTGACRMFHDLKWSPSEKKIARKAYDAALQSVLGKVMAEFKRRAAAASTPTEMWDVEDYLRHQRREINEV